MYFRMRAVELIKVASNFSILIPGLMCIVRLNLQNKIAYYLLILLILSGTVDIVSTIGAIDSGIRIGVVNFQDAIQFLLITVIYRQMFGGEYKSASLIMVFIYVIAASLNTLFLQPLTELQNLNWTLAAVLILFMSIGWMLHVLITMPVKKLVKYGEFWINTAFFCYFSISLFLFLSVNYVFKNQTTEAKVFFWSFHNINNVLKNILLGIGVYFFSDRFAGNKIQAALDLGLSRDRPTTKSVS
jgi:hypothetical protein